MEVILLEDVKSLGKKGQIVKINDGYARNFVLPKKLGLEATPKNLNDLRLQKAREAKEAAEELQAAKELAVKVEEKPVRLTMKTGEGGKTFGTISTKEVAAAAKEQLGLALREKIVELESRHMTDIVVERIIVGVRRVGAEKIAEDEIVRALLVEESLIIETSVEGGVAHILLHLIAVFESFAVDSACHLREWVTRNLLVEGGQTSRGTDVAQRIEFVAQTDVTHGERLLHIRILIVVHRASILLDSVEGDDGSIHSLMIVHSVGTVGKLALLSADEGGDALRLVAGSSTDVAIIAIAEIAASAAVHSLLVEYDVEHASRTFSIILGSRIGDYLNVLDHGSRHCLENLRGVGREHRVGFSIHIHLEAG